MQCFRHTDIITLRISRTPTTAGQSITGFCIVVSCMSCTAASKVWCILSRPIILWPLTWPGTYYVSWYKGEKSRYRACDCRACPTNCTARDHMYTWCISHVDFCRIRHVLGHSMWRVISSHSHVARKHLTRLWRRLTLFNRIQAVVLFGKVTIVYHGILSPSAWNDPPTLVLHNNTRHNFILCIFYLSVCLSITRW